MAVKAECCSKSWFHYDEDNEDHKEEDDEYDTNYSYVAKIDDKYIGKTITSINISNDYYVSEDSSDTLKKSDIIILFKDPNKNNEADLSSVLSWSFSLINSSNGYYSGWISISDKD